VQVSGRSAGGGADTSPLELGTIHPDAVHDHAEPAGKSNLRPLPAAPLCYLLSATTTASFARACCWQLRRAPYASSRRRIWRSGPSDQSLQIAIFAASARSEDRPLKSARIAPAPKRVDCKLRSAATIGPTIPLLLAARPLSCWPENRHALLWERRGTLRCTWLAREWESPPPTTRWVGVAYSVAAPSAPHAAQHDRTEHDGPRGLASC